MKSRTQGALKLCREEFRHDDAQDESVREVCDALEATDRYATALEAFVTDYISPYSEEERAKSNPTSPLGRAVRALKLRP